MRVPGQATHLGEGTTSPTLYRRLSSLARTRRPVAVWVCPIRATTVSKVRNGRPRQFCVLWQKSRCSPVFHLLVPGGTCDTWMRRPTSSASRCSAVFQPRERYPLLPPASAVIEALLHESSLVSCD